MVDLGGPSSYALPVRHACRAAMSGGDPQEPARPAQLRPAPGPASALSPFQDAMFVEKALPRSQRRVAHGLVPCVIRADDAQAAGDEPLRYDGVRPDALAVALPIIETLAYGRS